MTRSTSLLCLALVLGASAAAQGQALSDKARADAKKPAATAKAAAVDAAPVKALRGAAPAVNATRAAAPESMRSISPAKDGYSGCHAKDSDA